MTPGGAADRAGLQFGDLIKEFDGKVVTATSEVSFTTYFLLIFFFSVFCFLSVAFFFFFIFYLVGVVDIYIFLFSWLYTAYVSDLLRFIRHEKRHAMRSCTGG